MAFVPSRQRRLIEVRVKQFLIGPIAALLCSTSAVTIAETLQCPDLSTLIHVGACPGEEDLRYTFRGYCSDNQRMYDKEQLCLDYETYRAAKNVSLWESADGRFSAYLPCDGDRIRARRLRGVEVRGEANVKHVVCEYNGGVVMKFRTRARCVVEGAAAAVESHAIRCE